MSSEAGSQVGRHGGHRARACFSVWLVDRREIRASEEVPTVPGT